MNKGIVKEGILGVLKLRWYSLFKNYRTRVKKTEANNSSADPVEQNKVLAK
jgi:dolichol-phosphate mannosyltransferase